MSYCRFSSDNFNCDLYCYESVYGGYTIHVAGSRVVGEIPKVPSVMSVDTKDHEQVAGWLEKHKEQSDWLKTAGREKIGLPYDGSTIGCETLGEFKEMLLKLRSLGYRFPDYVLKNVDEEIAELGIDHKPEVME